jgi:hypothetical protein
VRLISNAAVRGSQILAFVTELLEGSESKAPSSHLNGVARLHFDDKNPS